MKTNEVFWLKLRFFLLFTIISLGIFIVLTKFLFKIPVVESKQLLNNIATSEGVFETQKGYIKKLKKTSSKIKEIPFDVVQVQVLDEIDKEILLYRKIYRENDMNNKFIFGVQSSKILKMYFDLNEEINALKRNNKALAVDLEECKANI